MGKHCHHCSLCGKTSHNVASCPLPGAAQFRKLQKQAKHTAGCVSKQSGRAKTKHSSGTFGKLRQVRSKKYSGTLRKTTAKETKKKAEVVVGEAGPPALTHGNVDLAKQVLDKYLKNGLCRWPRKCRKCKSGRYGRQLLYLAPRTRSKKQHVCSAGQFLIRCEHNECSHRPNVMRLGPWSRSIVAKINLLQMDSILRQYMQAKQKPPSDRSVGTAANIGRSAGRAVRQFLLEKTAEAGASASPSSITKETKPWTRNPDLKQRSPRACLLVMPQAGWRMSDGRDVHFNQKWQANRVKWFEAQSS